MKNSIKKNILIYAGLVMLILLVAVLGICTGSVSMSVSQVLKVLSGSALNGNDAVIIWKLRLPRILAAIILGGGLSVSGFLLQTFFRNPIAGPYVLGISSGAKLLVAFVLIASLKKGIMLTSQAMVAASFAGSVLVMILVLFVSKRVSTMAVLVVCGVMMGYICSAATEFLITFADDSNIIDLHNWSMGSFSGITWNDVLLAFFCVMPSVFISMLLAKAMWAFLMGEEYAISVGVNTGSFKVLLVILSSVLSAVTTAIAGPVSFVGIAVPHLTKMLFGSSRPLIIIPGAFLLGAVFCLLCDLIARNLFAPVELSISSVTAVFGAPVVIMMILSRSNHD